MANFVRVGVDLGKNYFQVHALESENGKAINRKLTRQSVRKFFSEANPCSVGMEACASSHYWARELIAMGHDVQLIPPVYVKPYVKRGKNDAADAAAICEAMSRPDMRFVPVKSEESQATLMLHKTRELLIKQQTMCVNALRGHLAEFGIIVARGIGRISELVEMVSGESTLPAAAKLALQSFVDNLATINLSLTNLDCAIAKSHAENATSQLLAKIPGIGKMTASAIAASVPDPSVFKSGRDFSAWLGATPRQNSSGGKEKLGSITKQGNAYIRRLLVLGATSLLNQVGKRTGPLHTWLVGLLARRPARLVTVAVANKLARIAWAIMRTGEAFRVEVFAKA